MAWQSEQLDFTLCQQSIQRHLYNSTRSMNQKKALQGPKAATHVVGWSISSNAKGTRLQLHQNLHVKLSSQRKLCRLTLLKDGEGWLCGGGGMHFLRAPFPDRVYPLSFLVVLNLLAFLWFDFENLILSWIIMFLKTIHKRKLHLSWNGGNGHFSLRVSTYIFRTSRSSAPRP